MPERDIFALDRAGFNGFLFAGVGSQPDGSCLTVLSALARLGEDPWSTAADWAAMSHAAAAEALVARIAQMPLVPADLHAAPQTAARLVLLLSPGGRAASGRSRVPAAPPAASSTMTLMWAVACAAILAGGAVIAARHGALPGTALPGLAASAGQ